MAEGIIHPAYAIWRDMKANNPNTRITECKPIPAAALRKLFFKPFGRIVR
jgi:hypothetical protein